MGAKFSLAEKLRKCDRIRTTIGDYITGEAREFARQMLDDSVTSSKELSSWISNYYNGVRTHSGHCRLAVSCEGRSWTASRASRN
jgi:hypothetical protein